MVIADIRDLPDDQTVSADTIVVGSGIAGSEVALYLARRGVDVVLLESGRELFDPEIQALNDLEFRGKPHRALDPDAGYHSYLPPGLRGVSRVRQFGGTSNVWTGKWKHLQRSDFDERSWVPGSAWPITLDDLLPFYRDAAAEYGLGDLEAERERTPLPDLRTELARHGLKMSSFFWEETPTRTRLRFVDEMRALPNLKVVLGATATCLERQEDGRTIDGVTCRSLEGGRLSARGRRIVLATGGIEAARLLLASGSERHRAPGNAHGQVGRFYTDHPKHHSGVLYPGGLARAYAAEMQYSPKPRYCLCFSLDDETQAAHELLEHVIYLKPIYENRREVIGRMLRGGKACRDGLGTVASYRVKFVTEQAPNPESRVLLSDELDALGMRRAVLDWRFTELDHRSLERVLRLAAERFERSGLGSFDFGGTPPTIENMTDAAHQMGTTRMSASPEDGVVDPDCRVWGTDNLFVASSSVFPTGPSYSPTFTILALARRLGAKIVSDRASEPVAQSA